MQRLVRVFEDFVYGFDSGVDVPMEAAYALVRGLDSPALVGSNQGTGLRFGTSSL